MKDNNIRTLDQIWLQKDENVWSDDTDTVVLHRNELRYIMDIVESANLFRYKDCYDRKLYNAKDNAQNAGLLIKHIVRAKE